MSNLVRQASMIALRDLIKAGRMAGDVLVQSEHFERAFSSVRPSVGGRDRQRYQAMGTKYGVAQPQSQPERPQLRFSPGMLVRLASQSGLVVGLASDHQVEVRLGSDTTTDTTTVTKVQSEDLQPTIPGQSDWVKCLVWDSLETLGQLSSIDEELNALVQFSPEVTETFKLEKLCKVDPSFA